MNHNEITWIGTHLGITNDKGGLEAAQTGNFTVVNLAEESRNPTANIFAPLPLFHVNINSLNKIAGVIDNLLSKEGNKPKIVIHDELGSERCGLVAAWLLHVVNGVKLDEAYQLVIEKRPNVLDCTHWINTEGTNQGEYEVTRKT